LAVIFNPALYDYIDLGVFILKYGYHRPQIVLFLKNEDFLSFFKNLGEEVKAGLWGDIYMKPKDPPN